MPEPLIIDDAATTVWKYPMPGPRCGIEMPQGAQVLAVAVHNHEIVLWAAVNRARRDAPRWFEAVNTGGKLPAVPKTFLGTVTDHDEHGGLVVWHVFELGTPARDPVAGNSISGSVTGSVLQVGHVGGSVRV